MAREMKDSGIEWIGEIPRKWEAQKLKHSLQWKSEKGKPNATVLSLYRDYGVVPKDSRDDNYNVTSLDTSNYKVVSKGDFVINKMKAWQGSMAVSNYDGIVSPAYHVCVITNPNIFLRYFHYLLRNQSYLPEYRRLSSGLRIGQWDLGFDDFKNIPFVIPPLQEQQAIADFLDTQCTHIDSVIEKTRAAIEEYKRLKQSVITQAVTKGICPNREMKDSGIEWIGEIPAEQHSDLEKTTGNKASNADGYKIVCENDIIVNIILCWMGAIGRSDYQGVTSPAYDIYVPSNTIECRFYHHYFRTKGFSGDCYKRGKGIMAMRWRTYSDQFRDIKVVVPPLEEQQEILKHLDEKTAVIDSLIQKPT